MTLEEAKNVIYANAIYACEKAELSSSTIAIVKDACDTVIALAEQADTPQTEMTEDDAFYIVFKDLTKDEGLFTGRYDAKNGSRQYMHGINSVMEYIAYKVGEDCLDAWVDRFAKNMIESQEKAGRGE